MIIVCALAPPPLPTRSCDSDRDGEGQVQVRRYKLGEADSKGRCDCRDVVKSTGR